LNIEVAIAALRRHILPEDRDALPEIEALIRATAFPYKDAGSSLGLAGQILRDADLSQALNPSWIQQVVFGLAEEGELYPWMYEKGSARSSARSGSTPNGHANCFHLI
jgi:hypothetical protein